MGEEVGPAAADRVHRRVVGDELHGFAAPDDPEPPPPFARPDGHVGRGRLDRHRRVVPRPRPGRVDSLHPDDHVGKAALADDYLALKEEQLKAEAEFQEKAAKLREKAAEGGKEGKAAEEELQRLEAIKRLRDDAFAAEESRLLAEGDANVEARDTAESEPCQAPLPARGRVALRTSGAHSPDRLSRQVSHGRVGD